MQRGVRPSGSLLTGRLTFLRSLWIAFYMTAPGLAAACSSALGPPNRGEVRFRVDVTLREQGIQKQGSAVWSFSLEKPTVALVRPYSSHFEAEAIPIKLGSGEWAFVLPSNVRVNDSAAKWPELAFGFSQEVRNGGGPDALGRLGAMYGRSAHIECVDSTELGRIKPSSVACPTVLVSNQIAEPRSFRLVDHAAGSTPRSGLQVEKVTITITDRPVTRRLERVLPWLGEASRLYGKDRSEFYKYMRGVPEYVMRLQEPFLRTARVSN